MRNRGSRWAALFDDAMGGRPVGPELSVVATAGQVLPEVHVGDLVIRRALGEGRLAFAARVESAAETKRRARAHSARR